MNKKEALALFKEGCPFCGSKKLNVYRDGFKRWHIECGYVFVVLILNSLINRIVYDSRFKNLTLEIKRD